jgi:ATP-dependent Clp protease ATP-binding subunit ClpA
VNLSKCLIFMTSNLGAAEMSSMMSGGYGFARVQQHQVDVNLDDRITRTAQEAARKKFSPEFMNRIDKVVVFKTLRPEHLERILELELEMVQQRIAQAAESSRFVFRCTPKVKRFLLHEGTDVRYGARHLKRAIERHLVFPLANLVATGQVKMGDAVTVDLAKDGNLIFTKAMTAAATGSKAADNEAAKGSE